MSSFPLTTPGLRRAQFPVTALELGLFSLTTRNTKTPPGASLPAAFS
jgi:hypothetical protein